MEQSDWQAVAAEVAVALDDAGFKATLRKPGGGSSGDPWNPTPAGPSDHEITVVQETREIRDATGTLVGQSVRTLTVATGSAEPGKSDRVEVPAGSGSWYSVSDVRPFAPGGVVLYWDVDITGG